MDYWNDLKRTPKHFRFRSFMFFKRIIILFLDAEILNYNVLMYVTKTMQTITEFRISKVFKPHHFLFHSTKSLSSNIPAHQLPRKSLWQWKKFNFIENWKISIVWYFLNVSITFYTIRIVKRIYFTNFTVIT